MQRAIIHQSIVSPIQAQATRMISSDSTGMDHKASNDESYGEESSSWRWLLALMGNVIGGSILLCAMFVLPHVISRLFI